MRCSSYWQASSKMNGAASPVQIPNALPLSTFDTGQTFPQYVTANHSLLHGNESLVLCVCSFSLDEEHAGVQHVQQLRVSPSCRSRTATRVAKLVYTATTPLAGGTFFVCRMDLFFCQFPARVPYLGFCQFVILLHSIHHLTRFSCIFQMRS